MKSLFTFFILLVCCVMIMIPMGCDILTQAPPPTGPSYGNDLVINEVFSISPKQFNHYSWIEIYNASSPSDPQDGFRQFLSFDIPAFAYVAGANGAMFFTANSGQPWQSMVLNPSQSSTFNSTSFVNQDTGYVVGNAGVFKKMTRNGDSDTLQVSGNISTPAGSVNFNDVVTPRPPDVTNSQIGKLVLAVGDQGAYIYSIDWGTTFRSISMPSGIGNPNLRSIKFSGPTSVLIVGDKGTILSGLLGQTPTVKSPPPVQANVNYYDIFMYNPSVSTSLGFVVGDGGSIARTTNTGVVWKPVQSGVTGVLRSIFANSDIFPNHTAWIVGDHGTILRLDDSVVTNLSPNGITNNLHSISFIDTARGWACGDGGIILSTQDGGHKWFRTQVGSNNLLSMSFLPLLYQTQTFYVLGIYAHKERVIGSVVIGDTMTVIAIPLIPSNPFASMAPGAFLIIGNDSTQLFDHTYIANAPAGVFKFFPELLHDFDANNQEYSYKWLLPDAGEMRLYSVSFKQYIGTPPPGAPPITNPLVTRTVDVVRWGGFKATHGEFKGFPIVDINLGFFEQIFPLGLADSLQSYPQNIPIGYIPEWSSMARHFNMVSVTPGTENTNSSFYFTASPLPGWPSLK